MSTFVVSNLEVGYAAGRPVTRASFSSEPGHIVAIVGPNGAGKSTLLRTMLGLQPALGGSVTLGGKPAAAWRKESGIGYLAESTNLPVVWSVRTAIALTVGACRRGTPIDRAYALRLAGVDFDEDLAVAEMSKGMRQRLALALAFMPVPQLVLLDEPEAGLDPAQRVRFRESLRQYAAAGHIAIIASHDVSGICTVADTLYFCGSGTLTQITREQLGNSAELVRLFEGGSHDR